MTRIESIKKGLIEAFLRMGKTILENDKELENLDFTNFRSNFNITDPENPSSHERFSVCLSIEKLPVEQIISPKPYTKDY
jgi:hypothetical protein